MVNTFYYPGINCVTVVQTKQTKETAYTGETETTTVLQTSDVTAQQHKLGRTATADFRKQLVMLSSC